MAIFLRFDSFAIPRTWDDIIITILLKQTFKILKNYLFGKQQQQQ